MSSEVETQAAEVAAAEQRRQQRRQRRRMVAHLIRQGVAVVVLLVVVVGVYLYWTHADHAPAAHEAAAPQGPLPVGVITVEEQDVPLSARFLAQTEASQMVPLRARVSGYLIERTFTEGEHVEAGQVLFRIDPQPFEVALSQARAQLAGAEARLQRAEQQLTRFRNLAELQSAAANELEQWQEEQQVATAEVNLQQARVEQAELDLSYATIRSPIDGLIGQAEQDVGSYISPTGDALLATVRKVDPMYVRFSVSEQDLLQWQRLFSSGAVSDVAVEELTVTVILPDGREHPYTGAINFVDVAIDPSTGTAVIRATIPNPEGSLLPGQFVNVVITGAERLNTVLVPQSAVMQTPMGTTVYVVNAEGNAEMRTVTPGEWYEEYWIIESGLSAGDQVIVDRLLQVRPGVPVEPQPQAAPQLEAPQAGPQAEAGPTAQPVTQPAATQPAIQPVE